MDSRLKVKGSNINQYSPFAERELTLSDIDSMFQNGEITVEEAQKMALRIVAETNDTAILHALIRK